MSNLNNLPPFFVGQKVVCVKANADSLGNNLVRDNTYTVQGVHKCECGWKVSVGGITDNRIIRCPCGCPDPDTNVWWFSNRFAPLDQTSFPAMTFKEIQKVEVKEPLVMN